MKRIDIPNAWYCDALPSGEYAAVLLSSGEPSGLIQTHLGILNHPNFLVPLFIRISNVGGFKFAGQSATTPQTIKYDNGAWKLLDVVACGISPVIYDKAGDLHISDCSIGTQGWRYCDQITGELITGDMTYGPKDGLMEYTDLGIDLSIGQGHDYGGVLIFDGEDLRELEKGFCRFVRAFRPANSNDISVAFYNEKTRVASIIWTNEDELRALPIFVPPVVPPIPPIPPVPPEVKTMTGYGKLISDVEPASLVPHPDNDGTFLIRVLNGQNLSVNSAGELHLTTNESSDEKWSQGNKCMVNKNTFNGIKYFFLEWFD